MRRWMLNENKWIQVFIVQGEFESEIIKGLLEAQEIPVLLSREGAGRALGLTVGPLGEVEILVPKRFHNQAATIIEQYKAGTFDLPEDEDL